MVSIKPFSLQSLKDNYRQPFQPAQNVQWKNLSLEEKLKQSEAVLNTHPSLLAKNQYLHQLLDQDERLCYTLIKKHLQTFLPILYTPTVGEVASTFHKTRPHTRGLYIRWDDRNRIDQLLTPYRDGIVDIAVLTDGERILGLGDQGLGGIEICVAKAMLYVLCAGIAPYRLLPIYLDVGTNNPHLLSDPNYSGWRHKRLAQQDYDAFIHTVVTALHQKFPGIYLHWEDLERDNAKRILDRYRRQYRVFNDDMQGTGVVTLAGALAAVNITKVPLIEQRIVIVGAGGAGIGIADQLCQAMQKMGLSKEKAQKNIWLVGRYGLLFSDSPSLTALQKPYARVVAERQQFKSVAFNESVNLDKIVAEAHPTFLIGCSGQAGIFTESIIRTMASQVERPIIFPLSNPTQCCEATPKDILHWTENKALIATGSPFPDAVINAKRFNIAQCNNALAFPGIGLGIQASCAPLITDEMLWEASLAIANMASSCTTEDTFNLLPSTREIPRISQRVAYSVAQVSAKALDNTNDQAIAHRINEQYWDALKD